MSTLNVVSVPCSIGELIDKYTILCIKLEKIPAKQSTIQMEINQLLPILRNVVGDGFDSSSLMLELKEVNARLWDIEDRIRIKEQMQSFDDEFIRLARSVYLNNDERFCIKTKINHQFHSALFEVKSYC